MAGITSFGRGHSQRLNDFVCDVRDGRQIGIQLQSRTFHFFLQLELRFFVLSFQPLQFGLQMFDSIFLAR